MVEPLFKFASFTGGRDRMKKVMMKSKSSVLPSSFAVPHEVPTLDTPTARSPLARNLNEQKIQGIPNLEYHKELFF